MSLINPTRLSFECSPELSADDSRPAVSEFLTKADYREIHGDSSGLRAKRGSWWGWFTGGDPRRLPHSILVHGNRVSYEVVTQLVLFSPADRGVFQTEFQSLLSSVLGNVPPARTMEEAQRVRRRTDFRRLLIIAIATAVLAFAVLFTFF